MWGSKGFNTLRVKVQICQNWTENYTCINISKFQMDVPSLAAIPHVKIYSKEILRQLYKDVKNQEKMKIT